MNEFDRYISKLNEATNRPPETDAERGFQIAVKLIYTRYRMHKKEQ